MGDSLLHIPDRTRQIIYIVCLLCMIVMPLTPPIALLSGLIIALTIGHPFLKYNKKATTLLLQVSIVCLGFNVNLEHALKAGEKGFIFTITSIALTLIAGYFIGKRLKIDKTTSFLISSGTAICGGSAIAAVAPLVKANEQQMSVSLGTIFILNSVALFLFPWLGTVLSFSPEQFGTWCAIAIHDTSSVVGAAKQYGNGIDALNIATTIKLERALWIIPLSIATAYFQKKNNVEGKVKIKIPYFIFLFIVAIIIYTYVPLNIQISGLPFPLYEYIYMFGKKGLVITLFLIGSGLSLKTIKSVGWRPIVQGILLWVIIGVSSLLVIKNFIS